MKPYTRADRVSGLIQETLADILRKSIKDPRIEPVSITKIRMTSDLKLAKIYYVVSGRAPDKKAAALGFEKASGFIRRALGKELDLRYIPNLRFLYDDSIEYGIHMNRILSQLDHES